MTPSAALAARAQKRLRSLRRRTDVARFVHMLFRFVHEGLLLTNFEVERHAMPLAVADVLWAGEAEPRLLELLPALLVKRPAFFERGAKLPPDLSAVVRALRRDLVPADFRGIPGSDLRRWLRRVGRRDVAPSRLKSFRLKPSEQRLLEALASKLGVTETEVIRRGLRAVARR